MNVNLWLRKAIIALLLTSLTTFGSIVSTAVEAGLLNV
jgi:hypothetical protein